MAAIILAGGFSTRMGRDKSTLTMGGDMLLQLLATRFAEVMGRVIVALRPGQEAATGPGSVVYDVHQGIGPLGGLHAGLLASPDEENFVLACDMPFASAELAAHIISRLPDHDAVVPMLARGPEALYAAYTRSCLPAVESSIRAGRLRMRQMLELLDVLYIPENDLNEHDPGLRSFLNVNTPEEYQQALRLRSEANGS